MVKNPLKGTKLGDRIEAFEQEMEKSGEALLNGNWSYLDKMEKERQQRYKDSLQRNTEEV